MDENEIKCSNEDVLNLQGELNLKPSLSLACKLKGHRKRVYVCVAIGTRHVSGC